MKESNLLKAIWEFADFCNSQYGYKAKTIELFMYSAIDFVCRYKNDAYTGLSDEADIRELEELEKIIDDKIDYEAAIGILNDAIEKNGKNPDKLHTDSVVFAVRADWIPKQIIKMHPDKPVESLVVTAIDYTKDFLNVAPTDTIKKCLKTNPINHVEAQPKNAPIDAIREKWAKKLDEQNKRNEKETPKYKASLDEDALKSLKYTKEPEYVGKDKLCFAKKETNELKDFLKSEIVGQDQAIDTFVTAYYQILVRSDNQKKSPKPRATFLFAGPPGVGKTFLAEKAAEKIGLPFKRIDMSEYSDKEANLMFAGSDSVYTNGKEGEVTKFVNENPKSILLFDEIEKAHLNVIHLFLQILDAGRLRDSYSQKEVPFSDTIIICTTNAGKNLYNDYSITNLSTLPKKKIMHAISTDRNPITGDYFFPQAICSRFANGNVVMFNRLNATNLMSLVSKTLDKCSKEYDKSTEVKVNICNYLPTAIMLAEGGNADARTVNGRATSFFRDELYELIRLLSSNDIHRMNEVDIKISFEGCDKKTVQLFKKSEKPTVLIFAENKIADACRSCIKCADVYSASNISEAEDIISKKEITMILCDINCNAREQEIKLLNAEDMNSEGIEFLNLAIEKYCIPVFLLQKTENDITPDVFYSFTKIGVQGAVYTNPGKGKKLNKQIDEKCATVYQQSNLLELAKMNKVLSYKTKQTFDSDSSKATITLFNLKLSLVTDNEDSDSVVEDISKPDVHFEAVIGADDAKEELEYFVDYLKNPKIYIRRGMKTPKGVLLYGPPGTGKTMLAKALAGESGITFLKAEGNQFIKPNISNGIAEVHNVFARARKYAPAVLFIDEIDAIAQDRMGSGASTAAILNAFLTEMDGFNTDTSRPVFVLAATNYTLNMNGSQRLDSALMRRFDRRIYVDLPNKAERKKYIQMRMNATPCVNLSDEQIDSIATRSVNMSCNQLDSVFELAMRCAVRMHKTEVGDEDFSEAFETFIGGATKKWSIDSVKRTAIHEAGHALVGWLSGEKPSYVTIVSRGDAGGYTFYEKDEDKIGITKNEFLYCIRRSLAGRAAEIVYYGEEDGISTGASSDLKGATKMAQRMICTYGMDESSGLATVSDDILNYSVEIRTRVNVILKDQLNAAVNSLKENRPAFDALVDALMKKNHLKGNEINKIITEARSD